MILSVRTVAVAGLLAVTAGMAQADMLALNKKQRWLVVASTRDVDSAIGIAGHYREDNPRVVSAKNGWYAVVMGPYSARSVGELRARKEGAYAYPQDALLSRGGNYRETVWQSGQSAPAMQPFTAGQTLSLEGGDLKVSVKVDARPDGVTAGPTTLVGRMQEKELFHFSLGETGDAVPFGMAGLVRLDPQTAEPQIVVTRYSGGAHCCTKTWIVTRPAGHRDWVAVAAGEYDGDGYDFVDLNGDGAFELAAVDNNFLYMFDSYAGSFAPVTYRRLDGVSVIDVSGADVARHALRQDLAALEFQSRLDPENWRRNGYLAAWVASKIRLGEGEDAWSTMLQNFDRASEFVQQECAIESELESCPEGQKRDIPFPQALARFLEATGYGPLPIMAGVADP